MKLHSFIDEDDHGVPVEVELELWPGLPEIQFLGRADQHLRESAKRIKSAIRAQGFEYPIGQQILVNLRPSYLKKSSRGLELAVAAAYLMESGQIPRWVQDSQTKFYGELSLNGQVTAPPQLARLQIPDDTILVTGACSLPYSRREIRCLKDLREPKPLPPEQVPHDWSPAPDVLDLRISRRWANLLGPVALGGHSILLAGAAGCGKTTAARILHALMPTPNESEQKEILRRNPQAPHARVWRPWVHPHHTIPMYSLIGGGPRASGGDLARSDLGLLLLDEWLEFSPLVMEALREPLQEKRLRVTRGERVQDYPLRAQVVATTNLCPCGDYVPGIPRENCRFVPKKCRSYSQRMTGPLLDRFEVLALISGFESDLQRVTVRELRQQVEEARRRKQKEGRLEETETSIRHRCDPLSFDQWESEPSGSRRRRIATLKLAASVCDWQGQARIEAPHFQQAREWTLTNFEKIRRWEMDQRKW